MKILPHPLLTIFLTLLWLLLNNTVAFGQLLLGLFLGWVIPLLAGRFLLKVPPVCKPFKLCLFLLLILYDIVVANLHVARLVLGSPRKLRPAFVEVPMDIEDEFILTILTSIASLTPGTVSAGLSTDHRTLLLHVLDTDKPQDVAEELKTRYEAPLLEIFRCSST
ncbi:Na+/H+ antiporter subunit E [Azomonas macrocytogenes]|uniref:Multicomponent K+:H+ antiporter subunit E n=1 Tax=Azomonas macrocytogenes TaxID=69962 RepID=A0A839SY33_AZOMA|nr:Na+/H+ antiporter subunit E [Azomonas macrocytogenes]MBB3102271.1 multicomponent K+:H+ antiporter subunit E [Azomonas macrocytogenes]